MVVRVSRGHFDPARLEEVDRMVRETGEYLIPAIQKLAGLVRYFAAVSPSGSLVHVSVWETDAAAQQMGRLKEMIVDARQAAEAVGVKFEAIVNHEVRWTI
jgi:hypothetical protein